MNRLVVLVFFYGVSFISHGQPNQISLGIFTGITSPYTFDSGIDRDSRYQQRSQVKLVPIGISYGVDYQGLGFVITPSLISIGQDLDIVSSVGSREGTRKITMKYAQLPISLKLHVIDLAFLKVSMVGGVAVGYLMTGSETVTHNYGKYRFPAKVYPILPANYIIEYDGVIAPEIQKLEIVKQKDFNKVQIFGSFGFRSDWDLKESWRIAFDFRANYGFNETRTASYLARARGNQTLYDLNGSRREMFASLTVGVARYIEVDKQKTRKSKSFGKSKRRKGSSPARRKPRG